MTLATNDNYALGAIVLGLSLRESGTTRALVCLITDGVSPLMRCAAMRRRHVHAPPVAHWRRIVVCGRRACRRRLAAVYTHVHMAEAMYTTDAHVLGLARRPELAVTMTKLAAWRLTQYSKCVFLDADTVVLRNVDELFERDELSAAPDIGWPDMFNSGVFVFRPSEATYARLVEHTLTHGSFDGTPMRPPSCSRIAAATAAAAACAAALRASRRWRSGHPEPGLGRLAARRHLAPSAVHLQHGDRCGLLVLAGVPLLRRQGEDHALPGKPEAVAVAARSVRPHHPAGRYKSAHEGVRPALVEHPRPPCGHLCAPAPAGCAACRPRD